MRCEVRGSLRVEKSVAGTVAPAAGLCGSIKVGAGPQHPAYGGPYTATPQPGAQTLPTQGKHMEQDVTVEGIPFFVTENPAKGNTIYIGGN